MRSLWLRLKAFRRGVDLILRASAFQIIQVVLPAPTSAGDLARDGLFLVLLFCIRASLNIGGLPRRKHAGLPLLAMRLDASQTLLLQ